MCLVFQVKVLNSGLSEVTQQVAGAPELVTVPLQLKDLQTNVARFGSQLKDMDATVGALKTQTNAQDDCKKNITILEVRQSKINVYDTASSNGCSLTCRYEALPEGLNVLVSCNKLSQGGMVTVHNEVIIPILKNGCGAAGRAVVKTNTVKIFQM